MFLLLAGEKARTAGGRLCILGFVIWFVLLGYLGSRFWAVTACRARVLYRENRDARQLNEGRRLTIVYKIRRVVAHEHGWSDHEPNWRAGGQ